VLLHAEGRRDFTSVVNFFLLKHCLLLLVLNDVTMRVHQVTTLVHSSA
jgi:hypothetical protein